MIGSVCFSLLQRFYRKGFALECDEKKCEKKWVFNVKLMIPFAEPSKKEKGAEMAAKNTRRKWS
jgi:hypothetical protein